MEIPVGFLTGYTPIKKFVGGMGIVYICKNDNNKDKLLAIKTLKDKILNRKNIKQRFIKECHLWLILGKHPNIVEANNLLISNSQPLLVLEYQPLSLREKIKTTKLDLGKALKYAINICDAMIYVTNKYSGFVHRDLKPENILISDSDIAKVTDFGISHSLINDEENNSLYAPLRDKFDDNEAVETDANMMGTPYYMAPEQITGDQPVSTQTDIYAFGCILFEMLTSKYLFEGIANTKDFFHNHLEVTPPKASSVRKDIPSTIDAIIEKCLSKEQSKRYSNFNELRDILNLELKSLFNISIEKPSIPDIDTNKIFNSIRGLLRLGAINDAYSLYDILLTKKLTNKDKPLSKFILGSIKKVENKYDEAILLMEEALNLTEENDSNAISVILNDLGNAYQQNGDILKSVEVYQKCIETNPEIVYPYYNIANSYRDLGQYDLAIEFYNKAFKIAADPMYLLTLANLYSAELKNWEESYKIYDYLLQIYPNDSTIYFEYAKTLILEFIKSISVGNSISAKLVSQIKLARQHLEKSLQLGCSGSKYEQLNQMLTKVESIIFQT